MRPPTLRGIRRRRTRGTFVDPDCINWHPTAKAPPDKREFTETGRDFSVDVRARVLTNDPALNVLVLEEFSTPFPGFYLYYPQRRHASPALRALIDYLRLAGQKRRVATPKRR